MFGDVNVKVEDGNLGRSSSTGTGTSIKIGISNVESKSPILISGTMNAKKIKEKVGNTPLADACIDAVEWGASSIYCIPVKAGTAGTIGKITAPVSALAPVETSSASENCDERPRSATLSGIAVSAVLSGESGAPEEVSASFPGNNNINSNMTNNTPSAAKIPV